MLWYLSSQKREDDRLQREGACNGRGRGWKAPRHRADGGADRTAAEAQAAGQQVLEREQATRWLCVQVETEVEEDYRQVRRGRPGPNTEYRRVEVMTYRMVFVEDGAAIAADARCDGLFPLVTNDEDLTLHEALAKYKYQPFVEKRHEQLKTVFGVAPMWLKSPRRVASLLWLYFVVELVQALVEREVRQQMRARHIRQLHLYPEGRGSASPTASLVFNALEGHRRHRLFDEQGRLLRTFYDEVPQACQEVINMLGVQGAAYGLP